MIHKIQLENILFLDIETVPARRDFSDLTQLEQELWADKTRYKRRDQENPSEFYKNAGIWAEFGKILCISAGFFNFLGKKRSFRITTFTGDEKQLLQEFVALLEAHFNKRHHRLCAHNGKEFDFPYITRRLLINGLPVPQQLQHFGKKPWEIPHLDTMELWKFGDFKHYTSLKLLAHILGVPEPKEDMDGSMVRDVFYEEGDLKRIVHYCEQDAITVAQIILRLRNEELLKEDEIVYV